MSSTELLFTLAAILVLLDIFFVSDIPTLIAYLLITSGVIIHFEVNLLYQVLFGLIFLFCLVIFHYFLWRKVLERINDKFISPRKHIGGYESYIGKTGCIKEIDGILVLVVGEEVFNFESDGEVNIGNNYVIKDINSSKMIL